MLKNKVIYCIVTGANRTKSVPIFIDMLKKEGASKIILIPTPAAVSFLDYASIPDDVVIRCESDDEKIPEEDIVVVAPCTFNTFSKTAKGIADNYAMSILHAAIGKKRNNVILVPSMGPQFWFHPATSESLKTIIDYGVQVIWPEYIYDSAENLERITMAPWEKVLDSVCHKFGKIRYEWKYAECDNYDEIVEANFQDFKTIGLRMQQEEYTNAAAGFLAKKVGDSQILITGTGTCVGNLSKEDLVLITNHDNGIISCYGAHLPSSETPLVLEIFDHFPNVNVVMHGHCRSVTYSPKTTKFYSDGYLRYGRWGELQKIHDSLVCYCCCIMKLHGEIIIGEDFPEALNRYYEMYKTTL